MAARYLVKTLEELGLITLWTSPLDTKLLCAQRFVRLFAYGSSTLILVSYLSALGISKAKIGLFMTLTLVGDTLISFVLTIVADSVGRRAILLGGAALMAISGAIFARSGNYWVLLVAAVIGVISPSGNECGPFRAIEESTIAYLTPEAKRGDIFAWYSLLGAVGSAMGMGACGLLLSGLQEHLHWDVIRTYRTVFWIYSALGILLLLIMLCLSNSCEMVKAPVEDSNFSSDSEDEASSKKKNSIFSKLPSFSPKSRWVVIKLCILFALDSFASNLAPLSWITYFFQEKFTLHESQLGTIFFITTLIAAISMLPASAFAKRFGNIKTMVLAHLPQAIFLSLIPIPNSTPLAIAFLVLRSCTQSMDTAPRSAFQASAVDPKERTAMMGFIFISRSSASSVSPVITGILAGQGKLWIAFVVAGLLMVVYDLGMLVLFGRNTEIKENRWEIETDERGVDEVKRREDFADPEKGIETVQVVDDEKEKSLAKP